MFGFSSPLQLLLLGQKPLRLCRTTLCRHYMNRKHEKSVPHLCIHNTKISSFNTNRLLQQSSKLSENGARIFSIFLEPVHLLTMRKDSCEKSKHRPCHSSSLADRIYQGLTSGRVGGWKCYSDSKSLKRNTE